MSDDTALAKLREPFPDTAVDKLPRGIDKNKPKTSCRACGGYHEPASVHLDYVGHAQVTARLLEVDPHWTWEPTGFDDQGQPVLMRDQAGKPIGLWIRLTICGVTRLGFGELPAQKQADGVKEAIGDAIRNAAMRFGVALDLWAKSDLPTPETDKPAPVDDVRVQQVAEADNELARIIKLGVLDESSEATWKAYIRKHPDHPAKAIERFVELESKHQQAVQGELSGVPQ